MELKYKVLCIIAIIIGIVFCFYIYKLNNKKIEVIENSQNKLGLVGNKIGQRLVPIPKYDLKIDKTKINPYFDIFIGDKYSGKIVFELIDDVVPKTCMNFRFLCSKSFNQRSNIPAYQNKTIDIIRKDNFLMGGSGVNYSIYGNTFHDENFELTHNQAGMLAMFNEGPHTNNSKFIITLKPIPEFNKKYVVFGIIKSGYEVIEELNELETNDSFKPNVKCKIVKCGLME
jgi:cyclophilin family peptidyl-prolyl cis-trans isomerase